MTYSMISPWGEKFRIDFQYNCWRTLVGNECMYDMLKQGWKFI